MALPSIIKVRGYKLFRNDSYDEVLYSLVLESTSESLAKAITKCMNKAKILERDIKEKYGLVYYGFEVVTQVKDNGVWHVAVRVDYVSEESLEENEFLIDDIEEMSEEENKSIPLKVKDSDLMEKLILLNVIDELEMVLMKAPKLKDVISLAKSFGIKTPYLRLQELKNQGLIKIKDGRVSRWAL